jgi:hypothetical protein
MAHLTFTFVEKRGQWCKWSYIFAWFARSIEGAGFWKKKHKEVSLVSHRCILVSRYNKLEGENFQEV